MSALAGRWNFDGDPGAGQSCVRMLAAQQLYGPHDTRHCDDGAISIGRNLFASLPEDDYDRQPLSGGDGRFRLIADVRLDNRDELVAALAIDAVAARSMADAAILLAAWERWGEAMFGHLVGDYAIAIWDAHKRHLILARDPIGTRPLHYHVGAHFFAFASMPKGLHALPDVPYAPDEQRTAEMLALLPESGPRSFFAGISRVESGHLTIVSATGVVHRRHWNPTRESVGSFRGDAVEGLRHHLDQAVSARLRGADGTVGAHLSGGLDSAAVASTAARLSAPTGRVVAFTSVPRKGYDGPDPRNRFGNEGPLAARTAALHTNIDHVLVRPDGSSLLAGLDRDFYLQERPVLNACNQRWINAINTEAQRRGVRVMLTGGMGNMTISYAGWERLPELLAAGQLRQLMRESRALVKSGEVRWRGATVAAIGPWLPKRLWAALGHFHAAGALSLQDYSALNPDSATALDLSRLAADRGVDLSYRPRKNGFDTRLWVMQRVDPGNSGKGALGGWGIDTRDPTIDRRLVEFCLSLPMDAFLAHGDARSLARRALADRLPAEALKEKRKGVQAIDWHEAMSQDEMRAEVARLEQIPAARATLDLARMRRLIDDWPVDDWNSTKTQQSYRLALLRGVATGRFLLKVSRVNA